MSLTDKLEIVWNVNNNILPEYRKQIEDLLHKWSWVLPYWVRSVQFKWVDTTAALQVTQSFEYREIIIGISDSFFTYSNEQRNEFMLHEFCHSHTTRQMDVAWRMMKKVLTKEQMEMVEGECCEQVEHATESLAEVFAKLEPVVNEKFILPAEKNLYS